MSDLIRFYIRITICMLGLWAACMSVRACVDVEASAAARESRQAHDIVAFTE